MSQHSSFARPDQRFLALDSLMNAPPRPIVPNHSSADISLAAPSPGLTDFSDLQSTGHLSGSSNSNDGVLRISGQQQNPLVDWYTSPAGPWDPIHGRNQTVIRSGGKISYLPSGASFSEHRSHLTSPSECETTALGHLPSDSGYGSLTRQSEVDGSFHGDHDNCGDTTSISSHFAGFHFDRPTISLSEGWRQQAVFHNETSRPIDTNELICPHCNEKVKTKSELKKHEQKHTKPYHCKAHGCSRDGGFSTPNDVDRHMRSCHPELRSKGKCYSCTVDNCRSKDKRWPRADNFRQHLKRVHHIQPGDEDLEKYVYRPQLSPGPDLAGLETSVGDSLMSLNIGHDGLASNTWAISMQSVPQQTSRVPRELNDYMDQHLAQRDAVVAQQQHLAMMSRALTQVPSNLTPMSHLGLDTDSPVAQLEQPHCHSERPQEFAASSNGDQETEFEEPDFFNTSMSDDGLEEDEQSIIHHVSDPDSKATEASREEPRTVEGPISRGIHKPSVGSAAHDAQDSAIIVDDNDFHSNTSQSYATRSSLGDGLTQRLPGITTSPEARATEARLDVSDVIEDQDTAYGVLKAYEKQGLLAGLLQKLGYQKPTNAEAPPKTDAQPQRDASKNVHACPNTGCAKSFPRQCELRKHMKRHAKPYGCTFPLCDKRFGSKNDWKRHENGQHYHVEFWKCNEKSKLEPVELCQRAFNRREQFKTHLFKDHGIVDATIVEQRLLDCLDGRNYEVQFWCGFCRTMVKVKETGLKAWLSRFNHIDEHFSGQMDISEWKSPDPGLPEVDVYLKGFNEASHDGSYTTTVALSAGAERGGRSSKRDADGELPHPKPPKKARPSAVWYCCGCDNQSLMGFTAACLTPSCRDHKRCGACRVDAIPVDSYEHDV